ncbi:hypothetical protein Ga0466249_004841 [Sporomusaceae bacterium BoRhaA]|uniref:NlpC/P60 family protein n=1 Tax=Pelorhabdus rhamnosifermentans TaxID=2772457 RepID=UPI001C05FB74|nr:NlpC/P60 family protein [Pelorhabdus rhamnosifermentans]MBU2703693.1 hypothetical protein [Pelorhabdus rhamnosifermentans]
MRPEDLLQYIGKEYSKFDDEGKAYGCMMPVYMLYPEIPRYDWPEEGKYFAESVLALLKKHGCPIKLDEIKSGDVVAFRMPFGFLHIGVYMGDDWIVHCMTDETMERCRFSYAIRRLDGVFRWGRG